MAKDVSKVEINGNKMSWKMGVKKDSFGREYEVDVTIDVTGVTLEQALEICGSGQSTRVKVQDLCRKGKVGDLATLEVSGLKMTWDEVYEKREVSTADKIMRMSKDDFIEMMTEEFGLDEAQAIQMYNRKHGLN